MSRFDRARLAGPAGAHAADRLLGARRRRPAASPRWWRSRAERRRSAAARRRSSWPAGGRMRVRERQRRRERAGGCRGRLGAVARRGGLRRSCRAMLVVRLLGGLVRGFVGSSSCRPSSCRRSSCRRLLVGVSCGRLLLGGFRPASSWWLGVGLAVVLGGGLFASASLSVLATARRRKRQHGARAPKAPRCGASRSQTNVLQPPNRVRRREPIALIKLTKP